MIEKKSMEQARALFARCSPVFLALGDSQRQKLVLDIAEAAEDGMNVSALAAKSNLSRPAVSHHLKVLKTYGLVNPVKSGTQIFYRLNIFDAMDSLRSLLDEIDAIIENANISVPVKDEQPRGTV